MPTVNDCLMHNNNNNNKILHNFLKTEQCQLLIEKWISKQDCIICNKQRKLNEEEETILCSVLVCVCVWGNLET